MAVHQSLPCILLTGATGYIASHTWIALMEAGFQVIGIDNFRNSSPKVLERLATLIKQKPYFVEGDVRHQHVLDQAFELGQAIGNGIVAVVHFAALKAVGESSQIPLEYFDNNLGSLLALAQAQKRYASAGQPKNFVFSSSATVYGNPQVLPIPETAPLTSTNPYGSTKLMGEQILRDLEKCDASWHIAYLRYFNPVGAHPSGMIGEDPRGIPNNLMPYVAQVAAGRRQFLNIYGKDYATPDGTGIRDYIHVSDLAAGHVAAVKYLLNQERSMTVNLGTGQGYSVLEVVKSYELACGRSIPVEFAGRRQGDVAACYADPALAAQLLNWRATKSLAEMCADSWRWQHLNPQGFEP